MSGIDDTTKRMKDPGENLAFLLEAMASGGQSTPIERMERDGQQQLVDSDWLPVKFNVHRKSPDEAQAEYEALGFTFGDPDPSDPMFRPATLPPGWSRKGSDHAMWSYIVDEHGRERVGIFYKAAFYDRSAFMNLVSLSWYVTCSVEHDAGPVVYDEKWATREAVAKAMRDIRDGHLEEAGQFRGYAASDSRDEANRASCAEIADDKAAKAELYDAALAALADA